MQMPQGGIAWTSPRVLLLVAALSTWQSTRMHGPRLARGVYINDIVDLDDEGLRKTVQGKLLDEDPKAVLQVQTARMKQTDVDRDDDGELEAMLLAQAARKKPNDEDEDDDDEKDKKEKKKRDDEDDDEDKKADKADKETDKKGNDDNDKKDKTTDEGDDDKKKDNKKDEGDDEDKKSEKKGGEEDKEDSEAKKGEEEEDKKDGEAKDDGTPKDPGCYVMMPDGCPGKSWGDKPWKRDIYGEKNADAGTDRAACEEKRKVKFNTYCGKTNAQMLFIPPPPPEPKDQGCFYWHPSGCPEQKKDVLQEWTRDEAGEANMDAGKDPEICERKRKKGYDAMCGVTNTKMLFVHKAPETPDYPGCYVWMPNGCANHRKFGAQTEWKRDAWAEDNANAASDPSACEKRKLSFDKWCGVKDVKMLHIKAKD